jgi:inner membrane protein
VALLAYAPIGTIALAGGFETVAFAGAVYAVLFASIPDFEQGLASIPHRGPTHTVHFAVAVGVVTGLLGLSLGKLSVDLALGSALGLGLFGFLVGTTTMAAHVAADSLTPMGVRPFGDDRHYSFGVCKAANTRWNLLFFFLGATATVLAYGIGTNLGQVFGA